MEQKSMHVVYFRLTAISHWEYRFPSDHRSQTVSSHVSTWMGDLLGTRGAVSFSYFSNQLGALCEIYKLGTFYILLIFETKLPETKNIHIPVRITIIFCHCSSFIWSVWIKLNNFQQNWTCIMCAIGSLWNHNSSEWARRTCHFLFYLFYR